MHRLFLTLVVTCASVPVLAEGWQEDDFCWMHGANYVASYAATDVEMWLNYDHEVVDRELGYARKLGLNAVRVFLQSLVYHRDPEAFLASFEDFVATADSHGLKVMPILFDSCFGVSPSLESRHMWVANPGPDRIAKQWWPESDEYAKAVVSAHVGDRRIALWDVMNEPTATHQAHSPEGKALIDAFVAHYCVFVKQLDATHFADQARLYSAGQMRPAWHCWSQLRDHVESVKVVKYPPQEPEHDAL